MPDAALTKGRPVWVQDPSLKDEGVFFKGKVQSDDGKQAALASARGRREGMGLCWKRGWESGVTVGVRVGRCVAALRRRRRVE